MNALNIIILAAGSADFVVEDGDYPVCLVEIGGKPLLERVITNASRVEGAALYFAFRSDQIARFHLDKIVNLLVPDATVVSISDQTMGSGCTALMVASMLPENEEVLIVSANELVDIALDVVVQSFRDRQLDAGTITFPSVHPRYSYVRVDTDGSVTEVSQKVPISKRATAGVFWAARASDLVESIKQMIRKDANVDGQYYIAKAFNEIILNQKKMGFYDIISENYHPLKTARQVEQFQL